MIMDYSAKREQLDHDGFCLLESILQDDMLAGLSIEPLLPAYEGEAEPITINRTPEPQFQ